VLLEAPPPEYYLIGDVHGCLAEFLSLLSLLASRSSPPLPPAELHRRRVLCGDLVNKGPRSLDVLRYCRRFGILCVRGNHDDAALRARGRGRGKRGERYAWVEGMGPEDEAWLRSLPCTIRIPKHGTLVVHAGLVPGRRLGEATKHEMTTVREVVRRGDGSYAGVQHPREGGGEGRAWAELYGGEHGRVVFGHDARRGLQRAEHAVGLDTGEWHNLI
jgi:hypothetical protein